MQISDENLHHVRELLDEIFGADNYLNTIPFSKTSGVTTRVLASRVDFLLWFARDRARAKYRELYLEKSVDAGTADNYGWLELPSGERRGITAAERRDYRLIPPGGRIYKPDNITSQGNPVFPFRYQGKTYAQPWKTNPEGMRALAAAGRLHVARNSLQYVRYLTDSPCVPVTQLWDDTQTGSFTDEKLYSVQTGTKTLERCVLMSTDPGDLILDPTCGSGTAAYAAEHWGRRWITIDTSRVPLALTRQRLLTATFPYYELRDPHRGPSAGFVYRRKQNAKGEDVGGIVPHVTLGSIAQNETPQEEALVDRPERDDSVVRVSGPFVVEATIPTAIELEPSGTAAEIEADADPIGRMIEVLRSARTMRLAGNQTVAFKNVRRPARALELHAEADMLEPTLADLAEEAASQKSLDMRSGRPVAFVFGPKHGPVTEQLVYQAAREAHGKSFAHLFVIGFAIQPGASKLVQSCEQAMGIPATYVQATMDLLMRDLLKTSRSSQVFAVTGAPEIRLLKLKRKGDDAPLYRVELLGLDVFDPASVDTIHRKGDDVPAWLLDTDYDERVFHVHQAFFPRTSAWDNLRRALRGSYDDSVWEHLAGTLSEPFAAGDHARIAVKVIDDRGNELMVVQSLSEATPER